MEVVWELSGKLLTYKLPTGKWLLYAPYFVTLRQQKTASSIRGPRDHINRRILEAMISGIPLLVDRRTRT